MGKQKKIGLGQALNSSIKNNRLKPSVRHTTGSATKDFATLHSCTQENDLDSFLRTAALANVDFTAEKMNVKVINHRYSEAIPAPAEQAARHVAFLQHKEDVRIPRRPPWTKEMGKEELEQNERDAFMTWRRSLAVIQENQHIILTPFEKNLEVWRQLWRVTERSQIIIQIVDARDPMFYWCRDLQKYVLENGEDKENILLVNKSDYLSDTQRNAWSDYLKSQNIRSIFYSAINELEPDSPDESPENSDFPNKLMDLDDEETSILSNFNKFSLLSPSEEIPELGQPGSSAIDSAPAVQMTFEADENDSTREETSPDAELEPEEELSELEIKSREKTAILQKLEKGEILRNSDLLTYLSMLKDDSEYTIGLVGYPNVGKSCTLNSLLQEKRVQVSSTPGKTKHFQTFKLKIDDKDITLCDCPGLVFPNLACSQSEMFCEGILPIDHMRDHEGPIAYLIEKIPRIVLESVYGMRLPVPDELEGARLPYPHEVLREYGTLRGFMTTRGTPDESRAARILLKDYVNGKLLYVEPPPDYGTPADFNPICQKYMERVVSSAAKIKKSTVTLAKETVETNFFTPREVQMLVNGRTPAQFQQEGGVGEKPWKKHFKGNSKEKTRRKAADLDY